MKAAVVTGGAHGIGKCIAEEFRKQGVKVYVIDRADGDHYVGVTAPFYLSKLFAPYFREGACIINISSSRDRMSRPQTESYTAAKGGVAALTHAMAASFAGRVRVNSVSPGFITGENICIDGGMTKLMIYHDDHGWTYKSE